MSKGNTFENDFLKLTFQATAIANLADNAASSPLTSLYVSLHSADPGEAGDQTTNEVSAATQYTGYVRATVARSAAGWTVTNNQVIPAAAIDFVICSGGTGVTATYAAVGTAASGTGKVLYKGLLNPSIVIANGVTPRITTSSLITED